VADTTRFLAATVKAISIPASKVVDVGSCDGVRSTR